MVPTLTVIIASKLLMLRTSAYGSLRCRELGPNTSIPDPIVDSVDAFQGSERSWIVFSAVTHGRFCQFSDVYVLGSK